jgi:hypothetical protein
MRLAGELQADEDHDPERIAVWVRAIRSRLAAPVCSHDETGAN